MAKLPPDPLFIFKGTMKCVHCVFFLKDVRSLLYCGTDTGDVHVWDVKLFREIKKIKVGSQPCIFIHYNGKFVTQEKNSLVKIWKGNITDWILEFSVESDHAAFCRLTFCGNLIICPHLENSFKKISCENMKTIVYSETDKRLGLIMGLKFLKNTDSVLAIFEEGSVCTFNKDSKFVDKCKLTTDCLMAIDFCESSGYGIVGSSGVDLIKICIKDNKIINLQSVELTNPGVSSVAIRNDGVVFAAGTWNGAVKYFSGKTMKLLAVLPVHTMSIETLLFTNGSSEGDDKIQAKLLFAGSRDGRVTIWDLYSNR